MLIRFFALIVFAAICPGMVLVSWCGAGDAPDVITLKATLWSEHAQGPVLFNHKKHAETHRLDCAECHHEYEDGANIWIEGDPVHKCQECHDEPTITDEEKLPEEERVRNLKLAYHNSCRACHRQLKQKDPQAYEKAPTECEQCHPGQKKKQ